MKLSTLLAVLGVGILLVVGIQMTNRERVSRTAGVQAGDFLIPFDMNEVAELRIRRGEQDTVIAVRDGRWVVPAAFGYPADFNRLAGELRSLARMQIGQVIRGGEDLLDEFGLDPGAEMPADQPALILTFRDAQGQHLGELKVGRVRQTERDPRQPVFHSEDAYMRLDDGPVVLMSDALRMFPTTTAELIRSRLFELTAEDIQSLHLAQRTGEEVHIEQGTPGEFSAVDLTAEEELNSSRARQWFNAFRFVEFAEVAAPRHETVEDAFLESIDRLTIHTQDDRQIELRLGELSAAGTPYLQVEIRQAEDGSHHPDHAEFDGWTLTLPPHLQNQIFLQRDALIQVIQIEEE